MLLRGAVYGADREGDRAMNEYEYMTEACKATLMAKQLNTMAQSSWEPVTVWPDPLQPEMVVMLLRRQPLPQSRGAGRQ